MFKYEGVPTIFSKVVLGMPAIRLVFLWHMHQPFYKDLVTGEYRLPWVRMHALKDYYGMVKLLDEFPNVHQTFNLVPSLIAQIEDYVAGSARDPFLEVAAKPATELTQAERQFALHYLFQANVTNLIGRYPRYKQLYDFYAEYGYNAYRAEPHFSSQDFADLQVLSQLAWFDELTLQDPIVQQLIRKGSSFSVADQQAMLAKQKELLSAVLPAYSAAAQRGIVELATSPYYHPILPLLCDTDQGAVSSPRLTLPTQPFQHPEDAEEQLRRGLDLHQRVFGIRPQGSWPSEGSVSDEVFKIAHKLGVQWMATDEGVLGRSLGSYFQRGADEVLLPQCAEQLYTIYRYEKAETQMHLLFRDHSLSDLIGFVYSGMDANSAVEHFLLRIRAGCAPLLASGRDAVVSVILDGENAWEYYPGSGREFLRRLFAAIESDPQLEAATVSEAIERHNEKHFGQLSHVVPGSWINSNFNVWIGAPEDNRSWDYLRDARDFYAEHAASASVEQSKLAMEELLIAEGSDWNWWYGPEHHSANDRDFDDLYRKHLSNVYLALGAPPPDHLAQPIATARTEVHSLEPTAYISPKIDGTESSYFEWLGAAEYIADHRDSAMHGKKSYLSAIRVGIDENFLYFRLDPTNELLGHGDAASAVVGDFEVRLLVERTGAAGQNEAHRIVITIVGGGLASARIYAENDDTEKTQSEGGDDKTAASAKHPIGTPGGSEDRSRLEVYAGDLIEGKLALDHIGARIGDTLQLRASIWKDQLPVDALPPEGALAVPIVTREQLSALVTREHWSA